MSDTIKGSVNGCSLLNNSGEDGMCGMSTTFLKIQKITIDNSHSIISINMIKQTKSHPVGRVAKLNRTNCRKRHNR